MKRRNRFIPAREEGRQYGVFALPRFYPTADAGEQPRSWTTVVDATCSLVCAATLISLLGWWRKIAILSSIVAGYPAMKVNTAILLFCLGAAVWLKRHTTTGRFASIAANVMASGALLLAALTLLEYGFGVSLGIDNIFLPNWTAKAGDIPGRMSLGTAMDLALLAAAILLLDSLTRISRTLLSLSLLITVSAMVAYLYEAQPLFAVRVFNTMAANTAISLLLVQIACFAARPEREPVASLFSPELGVVGRLEFLASTWLLQILIGLLVSIGYRQGWLEVKFAFALFAVLIVALQTVLIWKNSYTLTRLARNKQKMEDVLRRNEKLAVAGRLAATISHEINNPLEAISNLLYLIQTAGTIEETSEYAETATQELRRVAQITTQTLSFYRENTLPKVCAVVPIAQSAVQLLRGRMSSFGVEIVEEYGDNVGELECSAGEMRQVLINLISNAMEATPAGGKIILRVRNSHMWDESGGRAVRIWLADSGSGMTPSVRRRIFEPFYTTKEKTGNGLGLWVAADLIQQQGGWMKVRSVVDGRWRGTTFLLTLPYNAGDEALFDQDDAVETNGLENG